CPERIVPRPLDRRSPMTRRYTRRDILELMGAAALGSTLLGPDDAIASAPAPTATPLRRPPSAAAEDLRGLFVILSTPYTASGAVDYDDLAFQVEWLEHAGAHGLVWPQNSSDYPRLTEDEIRRGMETLATANRGRSLALVLGVQRDA